MQNKPVLLKVREVSQILRIQRAKVYVLIEGGELTGIKVGGQWRVTLESLERMIGSESIDALFGLKAAA